MSNTSILLERNKSFAKDFAAAEIPILPKLRTVILSCGDARVDPAHIFGVELGEAVVLRNNGGRVSRAFIDELAALAFMVSKMDATDGKPNPFDVILVQHTNCGAQRFADPEFQSAEKANTGVDVSSVAITDQETNLKEDVERLRDASNIPGCLVVSAYLYDVKTGTAKEIGSPAPLRS